jgi:hypothetical protein
MSEYLYHLLEQKGIRLNMLDRATSQLIENATNKRKGIKKEDILNIDLSTLNKIFDAHLSYKLSQRKQFDTFTLPSVISRNQFKNRSPLGIQQENNILNFVLIREILEKGFPIVVRNSLYIFYFPVEVNKEIYNHFYSNKRALNHYERIRIEDQDKLIELREGRDYLNSLIFLLSFYSLLAQLKLIFKVDRVIAWKKSTMEGSFFEISNLKFVERLFGEHPKDSNLAKFLAYFYVLKDCFEEREWNTEIIYNLLEKFSYYLLVKNILDSNVIENLTKISIKLWKDSPRIKNISKKFIIDFMEKASGVRYLNEYFELGQLIRGGIYGMIYARGSENEKKIHEEASKIIDKLAKDLRNEILPGNFLEAFERDLVWLIGRGFRVSKDFREKLDKLSLELKVCDLSTFYLMKASLIFGLISPHSSEENGGEEKNDRE